MPGSRWTGTHRAGMDRWLRLPWAWILLALTIGLGVGGKLLEPVETGELPDLAPPVLLVATEDLHDGVFDGTVILLLGHGDGGTLGLVINRRLDGGPGAASGRLGRQGVLAGGPVEPERLSVVARRPLAGTVELHEGLHVTDDPELAERAVERGPAPDVRVYAGYAGWAAGQLERELLLGAWHVVPADPALVFDRELGVVHREAARRVAR